MRSFYSRHVVPRAKNACATVSHDYKNSETTIPFPATLTIDLANELRKKGRAFTFNFYSAEPFPWRGRRVLDKFEHDALARIERQDPGKGSPVRELQRTAFSSGSLPGDHGGNMCRLP